MDSQSDIIIQIRKAAEKKILFLPHAIRQMSLPERMIAASDVREVVTEGEIIEDYPEDARGHSCLMLGLGKDLQPVHVVCSPKKDYLAVITAYRPNPNEWDEGFKIRSQR